MDAGLLDLESRLTVFGERMDAEMDMKAYQGIITFRQIALKSGVDMIIENSLAREV